MAQDPAFLFYPGDYLRDTQTLSEKTQVAYDRIMCEHMRNICISQSQLKFFTKKLNDDEIDELMYVLNEKDGCFQISWVAESIIARRNYSESRRKNRKGKTSKTSNNISSSYDKHMENEIENENEVVIKEKDVYENIIKLFNNTCIKLKPVLKLNKQRIELIDKIILEYKPSHVLNFFEIVFNKVSESNFLNGGGDKGWKMTFDWMLIPENFLKIIENNYQDDKTNNKKTGKQYSDDFKRKIAAGLQS
ncbi:hypothetical protein [Seonamhaeicola sp.]|uniref:hypothetical protein n=1 Tax=Seonamhaeicola sp. TaxID=1912245 RepID=UPI0035660E08